MVVKELIEGEDYVKGTHTNPELRKPSKPSKTYTKTPDQPGWTRRNRFNKLSDAELLQDIQLRFEAHGGEGLASPQKAILLCGNKTKFFIKNAKLGLKAVSMAKKKRWRDLPCF